MPSETHMAAGLGFLWVLFWNGRLPKFPAVTIFSTIAVIMLAATYDRNQTKQLPLLSSWGEPSYYIIICIPESAEVA